MFDREFLLLPGPKSEELPCARDRLGAAGFWEQWMADPQECLDHPTIVPEVSSLLQNDVVTLSDQAEAIAKSVTGVVRVVNDYRLLRPRRVLASPRVC